MNQDETQTQMQQTPSPTPPALSLDNGGQAQTQVPPAQPQVPPAQTQSDGNLEKKIDNLTSLMQEFFTTLASGKASTKQESENQQEKPETPSEEDTKQLNEIDNMLGLSD